MMFHSKLHLTVLCCTTLINANDDIGLRLNRNYTICPHIARFVIFCWKYSTSLLSQNEASPYVHRFSRCDDKVAICMAYPNQFCNTETKSCDCEPDTYFDIDEMDCRFIKFNILAIFTLGAVGIAAIAIIFGILWRSFVRHLIKSEK